MALQIQNREREGVAIVDLSGRLTMGEEASALRDALRALIAGGANNVLLNLKDLSYIDSTGLGALVVCFTTLRKQGGKLKLEYVNRRNIELLLFTKLTTIFELFNDETDAVNSFFPDRAIKHFDILSFIQGQSE